MKATIDIRIMISYIQHTLPPFRHIQTMNTLAFIGAEKYVTEVFMREKEKWPNKGNDRQEVADSLIHNTTCHAQCLYQISKS